jgi:polyisoprenoid-binding protein YceI
MRSIDTTTSDLTRWIGTWVLDPARTTVTVRTKTMWVLPVKGTAKALRGDAQISPDGALTGTLIIDAASFNTKNKKRDDHLRSDAILAVVKFPTIDFTANGGRPTEGGEVEVTGELSVQGRSQPLTLLAQVAVTDTSATVSTKVEIDRSVWGVRWPGEAKLGAGLKNSVAICAHFERVSWDAPTRWARTPESARPASPRRWI